MRKPVAEAAPGARYYIGEREAGLSNEKEPLTRLSRLVIRLELGKLLRH